ncbi:MAG: rhodanese-like domain-containing protein [Microthrixaceae bacterium]|jgi:rhodanese-related sulfurtransferase
MSNVARYSPQETQKLITEEGYVHVDVRTQAEYEAGHPAGALNVPSMLAGPAGMVPNPDFMRVMSALFPKDAKLVLDCRSGARSLRAAEMLVSAGFTGIADQRAGFAGTRTPSGAMEPGWADAGLPVEKVTPGGTYAELQAKAGG